MSLYSRKRLFPSRYKHSILCFHQWIVFLISSFVCVQCITCSPDNLMWNITSNPVKFGNTAELTCFISNYDNTCTQELRQWIGGQQYTSLCQNTRCSDGTKYHVKLKTPCSYTLMISNFSIDDMNCDYSCFYGTHSYRRHLQLNSNAFVSIPRNKHKNMSVTGGFIDIQVSMEDVYPSPKCHALLARKNITNSLLVITLKKEYFYDVELQVNQPINLCDGNVTIYCYLGKEEIIVLNEYIDDCSDIHTSDSTGNSIISEVQVAGIIAVVAVATIGIGVYLYWKNTKRKNDNEDDIDTDDLIGLQEALKLQQGSETDKRYFIRVIILGTKSAGKTSLLRRLLKESIADVSSKEGIDIVIRRCKINIDDGQWIIDKDVSDDTTDRLHKEIIESDGNKTDFSKMKASADEGFSKLKTNTSVVDKLNANSCSAENENMNDSLSLVLPPDLISQVFPTTSNSNIPPNLYASCRLWDFGGQKEFFATNQTFLTSSAVYLMVADIADDISKDYFADFHNIGESVKFWFDNIKAVKTPVNEPNNELVDTSVIMVFTGTDKYEEANNRETSLKERKMELETQLCSIMGKSSKNLHLTKMFWLSNITDTDEEFEKLRLEISAAAKRTKLWVERVPLTWIRLEYLVEIKKHDGKNFINLSDMVRMAKHPDINILDIDEVLLFLRFQHELGNIIYFDDIQDLIILHPQWLSDAFRCLVLDNICDKLQHRSDWKTFVQNGQINYDLIIELFKSNCGNQFSEQAENLLILMEKMDVLFKISETESYIMPSRIPSVSFDKVCKQIGVKESICKRTSWFCLKFTFLPPAFFNHIFVYLLGKYQPTKMKNAQQSMAIFRGLCVFDIDKSERKLLVTMSTDTVALQLLSFSKEEEKFGIVCSNIRKDILRKATLIKQRYKFEILYKLHFKCSTGNYYEDTMSYKVLKSSPSYYCNQHKTQHQSEEIYMPWMMNKDEIQ